MNYTEQVKAAAAYVAGKIGASPDTALILGSGLGPLAEELEQAVTVPYSEIPHFPKSTVKGHEGKLVCGLLSGKRVLVMKGRAHFYEGYSMQAITLPMRMLQVLGVKTLLVTNACGGLNPALHPGALMLIRDHVNFMGDNPLIGPNVEEWGPRFPDMSRAYTPELRELAKAAAARCDIALFEGVYTAVSGPYYSSRAELSVVRGFGSDTIGMSTVPEVIVASHAGMRVLGISVVTDMAIPESLEGPTHEEVVKVANETGPRFIRLMKEIIRMM